MTNHKLCYLNACDYDSMYKNRPIFNIKQLPKRVLIKVEDEIFEQYALSGIFDEDENLLTNYRYYGKNLQHEEELDPGFTNTDPDPLDPGFTYPVIPWEPFEPEPEDPEVPEPDPEEPEPENPEPEEPKEPTDPEEPDTENPTTPDRPDLGEGEVDFPEIDDEDQSGSIDNGEGEGDISDLPDDDEEPGDDDEEEIIDLTKPKDPKFVEIKPINQDIIMRPWIEIESKWLDTTPGVHEYILVWEDPITIDNHLQYFTYSIQNDNPEKPYIYMKREKCEKLVEDIIYVGGGLDEEPQVEINDFPIIEYFGDEEDSDNEDDENVDDNVGNEDTELPDTEDKSENEDVDNTTVYSL